MLNHTPPVVCSGQRSHRGRFDAISAHMHLLGFGKWFAIGAVVDDVVAWEALGFVQLSRLKHP